MGSNDREGDETQPRLGPLLIVFDFDGTLIQENSDLVPFKELSFGKALVPRFASLRKEQGMGWTQVMQTQLAELATQEGYSKAGLLSCMRDIKMDPVLCHALKTLKGCQTPQVKLVIASDANTVFIEEILTANGIDNDTFASIYTNSGTWSTSDVLDVQPYQPLDAPHECPRLCPPNMCKTTIIQRVLRDFHLEDLENLRTVYVGDGSNDFCPSLSLQATDSVLVREGLALHKLIEKTLETEQTDQTAISSLGAPLSLQQAGDSHETTIEIESDFQVPQKVAAQVKIWQTHEQLGYMLLALIGEQSPQIKNAQATDAPDDCINAAERKLAQLTVEKGSHI